MLATIDSNRFNYKNRKGEFKHIDNKDLVNNIKNNTISEIDAKKDLNTLNKIKNIEIIKYKKRTTTQKELLHLFNDLLGTILTDKILMPSKDDENENENENENDNENDSDNDNMIKELNDSLDKIIDKSKSFEDQIKLFKKVENLSKYWHNNDYGEKELKFKIFKLRLAHLSNIIDKKIFERIFGHTFETLANKLINTTNKEENQIIVNDIEKNKEKLYEKDDDDNYVIQPSNRRIDLIDAIRLILDFIETIQLDLVWKHKTKNKLTIDVIKTRWILIVSSVKRILKILIQKCLEQKIIGFIMMIINYEYYDDFYDYCNVQLNIWKIKKNPFWCVYKMYLISAEGYRQAWVDLLIIKKTGEIWSSMKDVRKGMGVKNISDLVLKEIYGICETKNPTKEQIRKYKMTEREIFEKYDNLTEDELNTKSNKNVYVKNNLMSNIIKHCRGEKKEV